jgi:hypothetical protein
VQKSTMLVLADPNTGLLKRYVGRTLVLKVQSSLPLDKDEIELVRAHPERLIADSPEPGAA